METCATVGELEPKDLVALDEGTLTALLVILEFLTAMETCATGLDELEPKDVAAFDAAVLILLLAILETCIPRLDLELIVALPTPVGTKETPCQDLSPIFLACLSPLYSQPL